MTRHYVAPVYLAACLVLGGASAAGIMANLFLQILAIPLICWALWQFVHIRPTRELYAPLVILALLIGLLLLQLVPLPPSVWTLLPGRGSVVEGYRLIGKPLPWLPISLSPNDTVASLLWLLPAFANFLAITVLGAFRRRWIAWTIFTVTLGSIALGTLQVIGGVDGGMYFYRITNYGQAVGFFANSNHNATLLLCCIPFIAAVHVSALKTPRAARSSSAINLIAGSTYIFLIVGLITNSSLAGIGLAIPVAMTSWLLFGRHRLGHRWLIGVTCLISAAAVSIIAVGPFGNNLFGQQTVHVEQSRQTSFVRTLRAAHDFFPIGSGVGSFQPVYRTQEPLSTVTGTYMNHAHSDWLEILLETGLPGMALAGMFLVWWTGRARVIWKQENPDYFAQAAVVATAAIMLHSIVDYPLRTAALSATFASCIGLMLGVRPFVKPRRSESSARHLTL